MYREICAATLPTQGLAKTLANWGLTRLPRASGQNQPISSFPFE